MQQWSAEPPKAEQHAAHTGAAAGKASRQTVLAASFAHDAVPRGPAPLRRMAARAGQSLLTIVLLGSLIFCLARAMPGGPAYAILGLKATPAGVSAVDLQLGLDVPWWRQFAVWWLHLAQSDLGTSYLLNRPVTGLIGLYAVPSLMLCGAGLTLGLVLAFVAGLVMGQGGFGAAALRLACTGLYAVPGFFLGSVLLLVFAVWLRWLPGGGVAEARLAMPSLLDQLRHLLLPAVTLGLLIFPAPAQLFGEAVAAESARVYARAAAAKGLSPSAVLLRHVVRNAARPLIGWAGANLPGVVAGAVVVESVFDYPGLGWLLWQSAAGHDYPVLSGVVLLLGFTTILANAAADLCIQIFSPDADP